jgi:hypothetical protein
MPVLVLFSSVFVSMCCSILCALRVLLEAIKEARLHQERGNGTELDEHQRHLDANLKGRMARHHVPDCVVEVADVLRKTNARYLVHRHVTNPNHDPNGDPAQNFEKEVAVISFPSPLLLAPSPDTELLVSSPLTIFFVLKPMWLASGIDVRPFCLCGPVMLSVLCCVCWLDLRYVRLCLSVCLSVCVSAGCWSEVLRLLDA